MGRKSLADLKAENAQAQSEEEKPEVEEQTVETEEQRQVNEDLPVEDPPDEETEESAAEDETAEQESWMEQDNDDSESESETDSDTVSLQQHIGQRKQLRGKLREAKGENEELKAKIAELEAKVSQPATTQQASPTDKPKLEDFYDNEDPQGAYVEALTDWKVSQKFSHVEQTQSQKAQEQKRQQFVQQVGESVENHYQRAATLANKSNIDAKTYQAADLAVRTAIEEVLPGQGDFNTDLLIANLGDGSEKVMYYLGRNDAKLKQLQNKLAQDPSGIKASMYLGELKASIANPTQRRSAAPKPAARPKGDGGGTAPSSSKLKAQYEKAHKDGKIQDAWNAKKQAKAQGVDVSTW